MFAGLTGWHFLIIALVILLIFGATRLPALARSVGQSAKIFRNEMKDLDGSNGTTGSTDASTTTPGTADSVAKPDETAAKK